MDNIKKMRGYTILDDVYLLFKNKCDENETTPSQQIRKMIKEYIKYDPHKNKNN